MHRTEGTDPFVFAQLVYKLCLSSARYHRRHEVHDLKISPVITRPIRLNVVPRYQLPDSFSSQLTAIQAQYTIEDLDILHNPFHAKILSNQLPKNLDELTKGMAEELAFGFEKYWGSSTSWEAVPA